MVASRLDYSDPETAISLLAEFREGREAFHAFDDYDRVMNGTRETAAAKIEKLSGPLRNIAARLFGVTDKGFFLVQVSEWKLDYLAEALVHAIEVTNTLALANNLRALVEHLAAPVAIIKELEDLEKNLRGKGQEEALSSALGRTEKFIYRGYFGKSSKVTEDKNEQALHVNDCLKALKEEIADIEEIYEFLCEYVHPNHGSNFLVSTGQLGGGSLNPPKEFHRETLDRFRRCCTLCMVFLKERGVQRASVFVRLDDLLQLCFNPGANVNSVFAIKAATPKGDGKSRETAFFFPRARTPMEAINLCYEFLESGGYNPQERRSDGIADGFIYDVYSTDKGRIWFKVPMMKL